MAGLYGLRVCKLWSIQTFQKSESKQQGKFDQKSTESRAQKDLQGDVHRVRLLVFEYDTVWEST